MVRVQTHVKKMPSNAATKWDLIKSLMDAAVGLRLIGAKALVTGVEQALKLKGLHETISYR